MMTREALIGISEACQILEVSETALRQWTDEGRIKAFVTPGGHRRYLVTNLRKFMSSGRRPVGIRDLVIGLRDATHSLRGIARTSLPARTWYSRLDSDSRQSLANLGRSMLQTIIKYVTEPSRREDNIVSARSIGREFGELLAGSGLSLTDSVEAFILHRGPIMNAATSLIKRKEVFTGRIVETIPLVAHLMDESLVSLVAAHQQFRDGVQSIKVKETNR